MKLALAWSFALLVVLASPAAAQAPTVGPQPTITCPVGAVDIEPGQTIQAFVDLWPSGSLFCLRSGVHSVTSSVTPKSRDTFIGEYGAVLDGTGWTTTDDTQAAFRAHNQDIDYVTVRNLVIRHMPQHGIQAYYWMADHWTIEYNEIAYNQTGLEVAPDFLIQHNYIHDNVSRTPYDPVAAHRGGGYLAQRADRTTFDSNEIAYNGTEQKVVLSTGVNFRNNFVHHNLGDGIWYDTNYTAAALVEGNRVEDNGRAGIDMEAVNGAIVRTNTIRRNRDDGVFLFRSQNVETYSNTLDGNLGGVEYFLLCEPMPAGEDLQNNSTHDNAITVGAGFTVPSWASGLSFPASCPATTIAPYVNGSKHLTFTNNTYRVPSEPAWLWGGWQTWAEWQAIPQDATGTVNGSAPPPAPPPPPPPPPTGPVCVWYVTGATYLPGELAPATQLRARTFDQWLTDRQAEGWTLSSSTPVNKQQLRVVLACVGR